jgi:phage repressor protein C with HTH and peptisase S24 domain
MLTSDTRFRASIIGESMSPRWRDGETVEFIPWNRDAAPVGEDCYIERSDGLAFFKTLVRETETAYVIKGRNKAHRKEIIVSKHDVVRLAIADAIVVSRSKRMSAA